MQGSVVGGLAAHNTSFWSPLQEHPMDYILEMRNVTKTFGEV